MRSFANLHFLYTGPSGNDEKHGTADVDTALHVDFDIMETSTLQLNETKEFHGIIFHD